ncbi:response regulator [Jatrophihabitans cynanchi]|jgi:two-component system chemotaxis response regulator CheY|uniref:Response regulator n=1 Tax=Jatrophihabitans cynanchi TaxID=2944128 RepID=A0ABY7K021_9ACTN|nr:response regulator [Jatrophihabitans sp. SB3-54]WAX57858.1 response regulator [Jatrophihabitans sp. SB3-54]
MTVHAIVIDDSSAMRRILRRIVGQFGFEVCEAGNGREALDVLAASDPVPELALIDWNMPEMNGLEFIQAVRKDSRYTRLTLLMVTTESEQSQIVRALAAGAHEYLIKPFTADAVAEKLELLGLITVGV